MELGAPRACRTPRAGVKRGGPQELVARRRLVSRASSPGVHLCGRVSADGSLVGRCARPHVGAGARPDARAPPREAQGRSTQTDRRAGQAEGGDAHGQAHPPLNRGPQAHWAPCWGPCAGARCSGALVAAPQPATGASHSSGRPGARRTPATRVVGRCQTQRKRRPPQRERSPLRRVLADAQGLARLARHAGPHRSCLAARVALTR